MDARSANSVASPRPAPQLDHHIVQLDDFVERINNQTDLLANAIARLNGEGEGKKDGGSGGPAPAGLFGQLSTRRAQLDGAIQRNLEMTRRLVDLI